MSSIQEPSFKVSRRLKGRLLLCSLAILAVWLLLFDSYSLVNRFRWHREAEKLRIENATLQSTNKQLERQLELGLSDEMIEHIAREQYGMRRPGETVYRIEEND